MSSVTTSMIVLACILGGVALGMGLRRILPEQHRSSETKDVVKIGMGLVSTMTALLLGLLVASAKSAYDTKGGEISQMAAKMILLDRMLAQYGPETAEIRTGLRQAVGRAIAQMWPDEGAAGPQLDPSAASGEALYGRIEQLKPETALQSTCRSEALTLARDVGATRWLLFSQKASSVSKPFLAVVVFWLTVLFLSYGLYAPFNFTSICALVLCAVSVAGALFLVMELDHPFRGVIQLSSEPLREAMSHIGK
ncbi:MAG: hypothetical protein U0575_15420 [Phycisphaerales bacterium]